MGTLQPQQRRENLLQKQCWLSGRPKPTSTKWFGDDGVVAVSAWCAEPPAGLRVEDEAQAEERRQRLGLELRLAGAGAPLTLASCQSWSPQPAPGPARAVTGCATGGTPPSPRHDGEQHLPGKTLLRTWWADQARLTEAGLFYKMGISWLVWSRTVA